jgi:hypothetical protein
MKASFRQAVFVLALGGATEQIRKLTFVIWFFPDLTDICLEEFFYRSF